MNVNRNFIIIIAISKYCLIVFILFLKLESNKSTSNL